MNSDKLQKSKFIISLLKSSPDWVTSDTIYKAFKDQTDYSISHEELEEILIELKKQELILYYKTSNGVINCKAPLYLHTSPSTSSKPKKKYANPPNLSG